MKKDNREYKSFYELMKTYDLGNYGLVGHAKLKKLAENGEVEGIVSNKNLYYSIESIERYFSKIDNIRNQYYVYDDFLERIGITSSKKGYLSKVKRLCEETCLELLTLDIPITKSEKYFIKMSSYQQFKNEYLTIPEAFERNTITSTIYLFRKALTREGIKITKFVSTLDFMYVKKADLKIFEKISEGIHVNDAQKLLYILTPQSFYKILQEHKIGTYRGIKGKAFILKNDFKFLQSSQNKIYKSLEENYYTYEEIKLRFNEIGSVKENHYILQKTQKIEIPEIARVKKFKNKISLYSKTDIDAYIESLKKEREITELCDQTTSGYYNLYFEILKIANISFSESANLTEDFWFRYVKYALDRQHGSHDVRIRRLSSLRYITEIIVNFTRTREFFEFNEKELNIGLFNNVVPNSYQKELYSFLNVINESLEQRGKKMFDLTKINYPKPPKNNSKDKEIYTVEEYLALNSFVSDYEKHKKLAIEDVKNALNDKKRYKKYDSFWLYVLLHCNNGWRKSDVIEFPRFSSRMFDKYSLTSIASLENLQLTYKEAEKIVQYYKIQWFEHNKNHSKAKFYVSSVLTIPVAYAILICEFKCRMLHVHEEKNLIHFYTKRNYINSTVHDTFFKGFKEGFRFESRKMNRSVLSYTSAVIKAKLNDDPIEIARHLRGHTTTETTNIYIVIPQQHLDFITSQLFDTGYFGYIYDKVGNLLLGETVHEELIRREQTKSSLALKELLGDFVKLEDMSTYLKYLSQEREDLGKFFEELPKHELQKKINLINLGLSPAKEESYQCFFGSCIAKERGCSNCAFSIPHFYSLTAICERIKRTINKYEKSFSKEGIPEGEKTKLYNLLLGDYIKIEEAKRKFGCEIIEMFLDVDLGEFTDYLYGLPEPELIS